MQIDSCFQKRIATSRGVVGSSSGVAGSEGEINETGRPDYRNRVCHMRRSRIRRRRDVFMQAKRERILEAPQPFLQKFELNFDTRAVVFVENWGSGWEVTGRAQFVDADDVGITLEDSAVMHTYINRRTGEFSGEVKRDLSKLERGGRETVTYKQGTVSRGHSKQVSASPPRDGL
jgi:hypothetical protein